MNLLAIDTATEKFSVALRRAVRRDHTAGNDTWLFEADAGLRHSELVMDSVDVLLRKAELKPDDLSGVVCMGGPGSFTGLRIGFSVAKGLALSLGIPFAAIPTLDCIAWPFSSLSGICVPVLDAKQGAFFCALYRGGKRLCPYMDAGPAEIACAIEKENAPGILIGPGARLLYEKLSTVDMKIDIKYGTCLRWGNAETLLHIAEETQILNSPPDYSQGPEYIRKSDAEIQAAGTPPRTL